MNDEYLPTQFQDISKTAQQFKMAPALGQMLFDRYEVVSIIETSGYGQVFIVTDVETEQNYAIKTYKSELTDQQKEAEFWQSQRNKLMEVTQNKEAFVCFEKAVNYWDLLIKANQANADVYFLRAIGIGMLGKLELEQFGPHARKMKRPISKSLLAWKAFIEGNIKAAQTRLDKVEALLIRYDQAKHFHLPFAPV